MRTFTIVALLAVCACSQPAATPAPAEAVATYDFDQGEAMRRLMSVDPEGWGPNEETFKHVKGYDCVSREAYGGSFTVCNVPGGNVVDVAFRHKGNAPGQEDARTFALFPSDAFLALFPGEAPPTDEERDGQRRQVRAALDAPDGITAEPRFVYFNTHAVRVRHTGDMYELTATPLDEPGS